MERSRGGLNATSGCPSQVDVAQEPVGEGSREAGTNPEEATSESGTKPDDTGEAARGGEEDGVSIWIWLTGATTRLDESRMDFWRGERYHGAWGARMVGLNGEGGRQAGGSGRGDGGGRVAELVAGATVISGTFSGAGEMQYKYLPFQDQIVRISIFFNKGKETFGMFEKTPAFQMHMKISVFRSDSP